jgi:small GTP-binding protein
MAERNLRNVAIIAHIDHGKTTLVDFLLKQSHTFRDNEAAMTQDLIMDSNDQERERGITILAKNTAITYKGTKINIIDTPGHADFGGEVERTLAMADGCILLVDAQEGPMPQTRVVLAKAFELGLSPIVIINKIDKPASRISEVEEEVGALFLELATKDSQLEYPVLYAIGREGKSWKELPKDPTAPADLEPLFEKILEYVPAPKGDIALPFQLLITALLVLYAFVPHPSQWLPIIAGVLFSIHLLGDELYIAGIERTKLVTTYLASFIALYTLVLVSSAYLIAVSVWVIALCLLPVLYVAYRRTREQSWSFLEMLMFLGVAHFVYALVTQARPAEVFVIFAFTIIAHYVRWYLFYWSRLSDKHEARSVYVRDVALVHVILGVLFVAYLIEGYTGSMSIFFDPTLFYVWTILHIIFSATWFHATPSRV